MDEREDKAIYTCSDGVKIEISEKFEKISNSGKFHEFLNSRADEADYLTDGRLTGWEDLFRPQDGWLKDEEQIRAELLKRRRNCYTPKQKAAFRAEVMDALYGPEEEEEER